MALYLEHFGLEEPPFRITPHTDFFFEGAERGATLEALLYAIVHEEGIVKVSGEVGSGKTMLCRVLMERLPAEVESVYFATPSLERHEILHAIADELKLALPGERTALVLRELQDQLIQRYAGGKRVVILVDEAHMMPEETLEQVRLLSNLESSRHKLLQIALFGQPELDTTLAKPSLRQLRDRITHSFRTRPLTPREVGTYLSFRMRAAGYRGPNVFSAVAARRIGAASGGLTRRINILADKALLCAFTENTHGVTARHVRRAVADAEFSQPPKPRLSHRALAAGGAAALAAGIALGVGLHAWVAHQAAAGDPSTTRAPRAPVAVPAAAPAPTFAPAAATAAAPASDSVLQPLSNDQIRRIAAYRTEGHALLAERVDAARVLLERTPDERYAIELFVTGNPEPARIERFLLRARDLRTLEQIYVVPMAAGAGYRLRVVYGAYLSREEAFAAEKTLPPRYLKAFQPAVRSFAELRRTL